MKLPKRFTLSTLLLVMLLVSLVFGYAQWRRQWLLAEVRSLKLDDNVDVAVEDGWLWPTVQKWVQLDASYDGYAGLRFNNRPCTVETIGQQFVDTTARLEALGVEHVVWFYYNEKERRGRSFNGDRNYVAKQLSSNR